MDIVMPLFALFMILIPFLCIAFIAGWLVLFGWAFIIDTGVFKRRRRGHKAPGSPVEPTPLPQLQ